jgi:hypothetical protein
VASWAARRWLRVDAAYCAACAVLAIMFARPLSRLYDVPPGLVLGLGALTLAWASLLVAVSRGDRLLAPLVFVAGANALAAAALAVLALVAPAAGPRLLLAAVAIEVSGFAVVQLRLLRHGRGPVAG